MASSRNILCPCNSGSKFKHCCGALSPDAEKPSQRELERLIVEADDEGLRLGEEPKERAFKNVLRVVEHLGLDGVILVGENAPPIIQRIHTANKRIFRPIDMREGGIHLGFFMFRDLFATLSVPIIFGTPNLDLIAQLDFSEDQKRWLGTDEEAMSRFEDQALDLFDFGYGWMEFGHSRPVPDLAKGLIYRSHIFLEAASATATSAYDYRGTVQSAQIGTELALKAGLVCHDVDSKTLRKTYGHDLVTVAHALGGFEPLFDVDRVMRALDKFPNFAQSRYGGAQPSRIETGHILMNAQYIASEVTRLFTDRVLRKSAASSRVRSYPA